MEFRHLTNCFQIVEPTCPQLQAHYADPGSKLPVFPIPQMFRYISDHLLA